MAMVGAYIRGSADELKYVSAQASSEWEAFVTWIG